MNRIEITIAICVMAIITAGLGIHMTVDWALGMIVGVWLTHIAGYRTRED